MSTVKSVTFQLLRELGVTHVFGNPGSTEIAFLGDWPEDFQYILGLQGSVVVAMADGYAQITGEPSFVNLQSVAGVGHAMASGGLGFGLSAAVGLSLANKSRRVVAIIGDGSAMYTIQGLWSAARQSLPITYIILNNGGYGAMRAFGQLLQTSNIPGTELDGISFVGLAQSMSCETEQVDTAENLRAAFAQSLERVGPTLIEVVVSRELAAIIAGPNED